MSTVDTRVVEMQFNNKRFEQNAKQTMSTLDKLKEKLKFKGSDDGLRELQNASNSFSMDHIANAVDNIGDKFTLMGQIGMKAMGRIADAAVNAGISLVKSLSIDQISAGMSKYEQETNIVQTLYGSLKPKGTQLSEIYAVLDDLASYSDETSYSYTQMADAISKFVNAGIDLKDSEVMIEGIANAAAKAGIGIHDTEIIFRNFSDAMNKGRMQLMDWRSLQLSHIDTEWFKEAFIEEAINLGKLSKDGKVLVKEAKKNAKGVITAAAEYKDVRTNFGDTLVKGWLDVEVMEAVLKKYATRDLEGFGKEAFAAAQNAKTFTDVIDAVKDSVATGWSNSFRIMFGDLEEAIAFFTPMANTVIEFTASIDEARNKMLQGWKDAGGRDSMIGTLQTLWNVFLDISSLVERGFKTGFDVGGETSSGSALVAFTNHLKTAADGIYSFLTDPEVGKNLVWIFEAAGTALSQVWNIVKGIFLFVGSIIDQLKPFFKGTIKFFGEIGKDLTKFFLKLNQTGTIQKIFEKLAAVFKPITKRLTSITSKATELYKTARQWIKNNPKIQGMLKAFKESFWAFLDFLPKAVESVISFGESIIETVKNSDEWKAIVDAFNKYVKPVAEDIADLATKVAEDFTSFFNMDTSGETTLWDKIKKRFSVFDNLGPWFEQEWAKLKQKFPILQEIEDWWNTNPVVQEIKTFVSVITTAFNNAFSADTSGTNSLIEKFKIRFEAFTSVLGAYLTEKWAQFKVEYPILQQIEDFINNLFGNTEGVEKATGEVGNFLTGIWDKFVEIVSNVQFGDVLKFILAVIGLVKAAKLIGTFGNIFNIGKKIGEMIEGIVSLPGEISSTLKSFKLSNQAKLIISIGAAIWLLADALVKVSELDWDQVGSGLTAMGGLFLETGAFTVFVTRLTTFATGQGQKIVQSNALSQNTMLGIGAALWILADALIKVSSLDWDQVGSGLAAMGGLFLETGAFMVLVNNLTTFVQGPGERIIGSNALKGGTLIGIGAALWILADALLKVANLDWEHVATGLTAMGGLFVESGAFIVLVNNLSGPQVSAGVGAAAFGVAESVKILADTLIKISEYKWDDVKHGLLAMGLLFLEQGAFTVLVGRLSKIPDISAGIGQGAAAFGSAGAIGGLVDNLIKLVGQPWDEIEHGLSVLARLFAADGAFMVIVGGISAFAGIGAGVWASVALGVVLIAGAIGLAANIMLKLAGDAIASFSDGMAVVGANLSQYSDMVEGIKMNAINDSITAIKDIASAFAEVGIKNYGDLDGFRNNLSRMGGSLTLFGLNASLFNSEKAKSVTTALKDMATDLSGFPEVSDVSTSIGNIAGAIKLYADSMKDVVFGDEGAPDSTAIAKVFDALLGAIPGDEDLMEVAAFAEKGKGDDMTNFAIGLENIATAVSSFSTTAVTLDFTHMTEAIAALDAIASLSGHLGETTISATTGFGTFGVTVTNQAGNLTTFATDVVLLGSSLEAFGTSVGKVKVDDLKAGGEVLAQIADLNSKLPPEGGISQWFTGTQSLTRFSANLKLLGNGTKAFGLAISGGSFDADLAAEAGATLVKIAEANNALPPTGGWKQMLVGEQDLGKFGDNLTKLGEGTKNFCEAIGTESFNSSNIEAAGKALLAIVDVNNKLPDTGGLAQMFVGEKSLDNFGDNLSALGTGAAAFANATKGVEFSGNVEDAMKFILKMVNSQVRLSKLEFMYSMGTFAQELNAAATELVQLNGQIKGVTWEDTTALENLLDWAVGEQVKLGGTQYNKSLKNIGEDIRDFFNAINGVNNWLDGNKLERISGAASSVFDSINKTFTLGGEDGTYDGIGTMILDGITSGFYSETSLNKVTYAINVVNQAIIDKIRNDRTNFRNIGTWIPAGVGEGIRANKYAAINAAIIMMTEAILAVRRIGRIASPSKEFEEIGMYMDLGLAQGFQRYSQVVDNAAGEVSKNAILSVAKEMNDIQNLPLDNLEWTPTVRPVLDVSNIKENATSIDEMLSGIKGVGVNTRKMEIQAQLIGGDTKNDLSGIMQKVQDTADRLDELRETIVKMRIVLDTGAMVGGLKDEMDRQLGSKARLGRRGN